MAEQRIFTCSHCHKSVSAWSDGNPYYINEQGDKQYAYHPNHDLLSKCIGNDIPHICLGCGHEFNMDSLNPVSQCSRCHCEQLIACFNLEAQTCPYCKQGVLHGIMGAIS
ncbi:MAG: hypothetical protein HQK65_15655 [Desulfamplus sp.]|nr:hypothetical protein [Desulfamplus sp.]